MSSRTPQLRQSFLVTGVAVALVLATGFALLSSRSASRIVERQANPRGPDPATHVSSLRGVYEGAPRYDSSAAVVSLEYDVAIRAPHAARPVGVLKAVFALGRLSKLLAATDLPGGVRLDVVDAQGRRIVTPDSAELLRPLPQAADIPRQAHPATALLPGPGGSADLVVTVPTADGKWWVVFREPERAAYAVARTTATNIVLWTVALFGAALTLLVVFWRRLTRRVTEPVKAAGAIASRGAGRGLCRPG